MRVTSICLALTLFGCGDQRPPAPSSEQANQLNETENMLNALAANEKGPEANASGPSK